MALGEKPQGHTPSPRLGEGWNHARGSGGDGLIGGIHAPSRYSNGIIIIVFGLLGGKFSISDLKALRTGGLTGKTRIARHVSMMLGGTIATVTAFVVNNFTVQPAFVLWLAPAVVLTPVIVWWNRRIQAGRRPKGMP